jgi:hypothetical protein
MREFLESIQFSEFGLWVAGGDTIFAFPMILVLHTVGLGTVVGVSAILSFRVLGVGRGVPLADLQGAFRVIWWGFALNATTGVVLFIAAAADKAYQEIFYVKLVLIALALFTMSRLRRTVFGNPVALAGSIPQRAKGLAVASLVLWMGAIIAGRLMAYTTTF